MPQRVTDAQITQAATRAGVPVDLYRALVGRESRGRINALSPAGAGGPSQLMPGTAASLSSKYHIDTSTPQGNLQGGAYYLKEQLDRFKRPDLALSAYNSGPGGSESSGRVENFGETQAYVRNVLADSKLRGLSGTPTPQQPPGAAPAAPISPPAVQTGDLRQQTLRTLLQARRSGSTDRSGVIAALAQQRAPQPPPEHVGNLATPDGGKIPVVNETGGPVPKEANEVVAAAQRFIGTPYAWGGGGPGGPSKGFGRGAGTVGFDCSSLLQYAYAQQGKKIPRVTYEQFKTGTAVDAKNLQPGDAVFFHPGPNGPEHVGIFVGQGKYIQAPKTGDVVKVSNLADRGDYMGARRW